MIVAATDRAAWHALLSPFGAVDCTYLPEYHLAYSLRIRDSQPLLWHYESGGERMIYPFLLTPVPDTPCFDISSIYGYTGPLSTTEAPDFLRGAWEAFDAYAGEKRIIAEFIRFSPFHENQRFAHPQTIVEENRRLAVSHLPDSEEELLQLLGSKTRNMLRKAEKAGLAARELALPAHLPAFRTLYDETMDRNRAPEFFRYDESYWERLLLLGKGLRLFGVFAGDRLVGASMSVSHEPSALYHLGASLPDYARLGAGNLSLLAMSVGLMKAGARFLNMTGGRTVADSDPLLLFKKSNATGTAPFYIGKRILDTAAYKDVAGAWHKQTGAAPDANKIIFWR